MSESNQAQIDLWSGCAGEKWAAMQAILDVMLSHCTTKLKERAGSVSGLRVLDIGCGTGENGRRQPIRIPRHRVRIMYIMTNIMDFAA